MKLRYSGTCHACDQRLLAGTTADYDRATKTITCLPCLAQRTNLGSDVSEVPGDAPLSDQNPLPVNTFRGEQASVYEGQAGASARREYERLKTKREQAVRRAHPRLGGLVLAFSAEPRNVTAWATGALGEEKLGSELDRLSGSRARILHDRRIPGTKANIDHIVITSAGVFIIDAKKYAGRVRLQNDGNRFTGRTQKLFVGSRNCTKLVTGIHHQLSVVRACSAASSLNTDVAGMLCFVDARWPLIGAAFTIDGVHVLWPRRALRLLNRPGSLGENEIEIIHRTLANAFPAA